MSFTELSWFFYLTDRTVFLLPPIECLSVTVYKDTQDVQSPWNLSCYEFISPAQSWTEHDFWHKIKALQTFIVIQCSVFASSLDKVCVFSRSHNSSAQPQATSHHFMWLFIQHLLREKRHRIVNCPWQYHCLQMSGRRNSFAITFMHQTLSFSVWSLFWMKGWWNLESLL